MHLHFYAAKQIGSFIETILKSSPELQAKVGASKEGIRQEFMPGIFIPVIQPRINYKNSAIEINYHVGLNKGGAAGQYVFDYYFADAGKNVDVLNYDVKFIAVNAWLSTKTTQSNDARANHSSTMQTRNTRVWQHDIVHPDTTRSTNLIDVERSEVVLQPNDIRPQPSTTNLDRTGHPTMPFHATPSIKLGSDSLADFQASIATQQVFEIRGHLDLLNDSTYYADGTYIGNLYNGNTIWIKVNVWMPDGAGGKRQFYYTGFYRLISIENIFSNGQFKQHLSVIMAPAEDSRQ